MIEQAIFTALSGAPERGYHVVATSPDIVDQDLRELTNWGPLQGALSGSSCDGASVNFHPLPSGASCVSRSVVFGTPDSAIFGPRLYTQSLVVAMDDMARFANNPFALLRAVRAKGFLKVLEPAHSPLVPFQLAGRTPLVDEGLLAQFVDQWGEERIAWLIHSALTADALVLVNVARPELLVAGLLNCLPAECRTEMSFTTGLKLSPRRPFRVHVTTAESAQINRLQLQPGISIWDAEQEPPADFHPAGWAAYLLEAMALDRLSTVCTELERPRPGLRSADLTWLGQQLSDRLHGAPLATPRNPELPLDFCEPSDYSASRRIRHADLAHRLVGPPSVGAATIAPPRLAGPSAGLGPQSAEVLEQLGQLDDLVFDTIAGKAPALDELTRLWPRLTAQLPGDLVSESREQYLRYALKLWEQCHADGERDPIWAVSTLEILCLLFGDR